MSQGLDKPSLGTVVTIVAAMAANRVIGRDGKLPWHLPEDLQRFRRLTLTHAVIMGRKTWEFDLEKRILPQRTMIVVSQTLAPGNRQGAIVVPSIAAAFAAVPPTQSAFVIGGASLYAQTLSIADRVELTILDDPVAGDVVFPVDPATLATLFPQQQVIARSGYRFVSYYRSTPVYTEGC